MKFKKSYKFFTKINLVMGVLGGVLYTLQTKSSWYDTFEEFRKSRFALQATDFIFFDRWAIETVNQLLSNQPIDESLLKRIIAPVLTIAQQESYLLENVHIDEAIKLYYHIAALMVNEGLLKPLLYNKDYSTLEKAICTLPCNLINEREFIATLSEQIALVADRRAIDKTNHQYKEPIDPFKHFIPALAIAKAIIFFGKNNHIFSQPLALSDETIGSAFFGQSWLGLLGNSVMYAILRKTSYYIFDDKEVLSRVFEARRCMALLLGLANLFFHVSNDLVYNTHYWLPISCAYALFHYFMIKDHIYFIPEKIKNELPDKRNSYAYEFLKEAALLEEKIQILKLPKFENFRQKTITKKTIAEQQAFITNYLTEQMIRTMRTQQTKIDKAFQYYSDYVTMRKNIIRKYRLKDNPDDYYRDLIIKHPIGIKKNLVKKVFFGPWDTINKKTAYAPLKKIGYQLAKNTIPIASTALWLYLKK